MIKMDCLKQFLDYSFTFSVMFYVLTHIESAVYQNELLYCPCSAF